MTNAEVIINSLLDILEDEGKEFKRVCVDDGYATADSVVDHIINCPYRYKNKYTLCSQRKEEITNELCYECKYAWLLRQYE